MFETARKRGEMEDEEWKERWREHRCLIVRQAM
jgi:putative SOS response-associated peptidase YedK